LRADAALISADGAGGARTADAASSDRGRAAVVLPHRQPGLLYDAAAKPPCRPVASLGTDAAVTEMPGEKNMLILYDHRSSHRLVLFGIKSEAVDPNTCRTN